MCPSKVADGETRGWIVPIGGAEDKESRRRILKRFVQLSGGRDARIAVIPTASKLADTGERYEELFDRLEVGPLEVRNVAAVVLPQGALGTNLLGMSFLSRLGHFEIARGTLVMEQ